VVSARRGRAPQRQVFPPPRVAWTIRRLRREEEVPKVDYALRSQWPFVGGG